MNTQNLLKQFKRALYENNVELIEKLSILLEGERPTPPFGSIDILGRPHKTVIVGSQEWMAENLFCPELGCHYDNDPKNSEGGHGTLHSHHAIPAINALLPAGWRVATDPDWDKLVDVIGEDAGRKLKSKEGWVEDGSGTDDYGFRVLPAGRRTNDGSAFYGRGHSACFWSSSAHNGSDAWYRQFNYNYATVARYYTNRSYGFSVRLIKNK